MEEVLVWVLGLLWLAIPYLWKPILILMGIFLLLLVAGSIDVAISRRWEALGSTLSGLEFQLEEINRKLEEIELELDALSPRKEIENYDESLI